MASGILLTVPHELGTQRDSNAKNAALCLQAAFKRRLGVAIYMHVGDERRDICDLNRSACRERPFRQRIRNSLRALERPALLIDVHSFPPPAALIEIFFLSEQSHEPQAWVWELTSFLLAAGVRVAVRRGGENDIIGEAIHKFGAYATLIEFNEGLTDGRVNEICQSIGDWLQQQFFSATTPARRCSLM